MLELKICGIYVWKRTYLKKEAGYEKPTNRFNTSMG